MRIAMITRRGIGCGIGSVCLVLAAGLLVGAVASSAATTQLPRSSGPSLGGCTISVVGLEFGVYTVQNPAPLDATTFITFNCSPIPGEGSVRIAKITISRGASGTYFPRQMVGPGTERLGYNVYQDATRQTVWGDGSGGSEELTYDRPRPNQDITVTAYGRVDPLQPVSAGRYSDVLTVTIIF